MEYYDFVHSVFVEPSRHKIPPYWLSIDYKINLTDKTKPAFSSIYNLPENELKVFKEYIEYYFHLTVYIVLYISGPVHKKVW